MRAKAKAERSTKLGCARVRRGGKEARGTGLVRSGRREAGRAERAAEQANAGRGKELGHRAAGRGRENGKKWAERVREGREAAGLVPRLGQKGKKRSFSSKIPFLFLVFKSKFKCKPNANSIRVFEYTFHFQEK